MGEFLFMLTFYVFSISIADGSWHVNIVKPNDYWSSIYISTGMFIVLYPYHRDCYSRRI